MVEIEKRKRGRPIKEDARREQLVVRLSKKELARVHMLADAQGVSVNEAMRIMLNDYFERRRV